MRQWPSESAARRNAAALELRLHQEGWLDAKVQPRWIHPKRSTTLILDVTMGQRWTIDEVRWKVGASGLPLGALQRIAQLDEGMPMEMGRLVDAQERIAAWAQSHGYATVHTGLIAYELDTLGQSQGRSATLEVEIAPWNPAGMPWMSDIRDTLALLPRPHPLVRMGQVRWNGETPGPNTEQANLRPDVWRHAVDVAPGESFKPEKLSRAYRGLTGLNMFSRVNVAQSLRWDTAAQEREVGLPGAVVMDVDFLVEPKETHDIAVELDFIRNDARYGPQLGITMLRHNARRWGGENAWFAGFGYVAVAPFANFNREGLLNSGEWSLSWRRTRVGIPPISLDKLLPSAAPVTAIEFGWDREIWPEFTRSQIHAKHDFSFTENPSKGSVVHISLIDVSLVNLSNRSVGFVDWLEDQENPRGRTFQQPRNPGIFRVMGTPVDGGAPGREDGRCRRVGQEGWHRCLPHVVVLLRGRLTTKRVLGWWWRGSLWFSTVEASWAFTAAKQPAGTGCVRHSTCVLAWHKPGKTPHLCLWSSRFSQAVQTAFADGPSGPSDQELWREARWPVPSKEWGTSVWTCNTNGGSSQTNPGNPRGLSMPGTCGFTARMPPRARDGRMASGTVLP